MIYSNNLDLPLLANVPRSSGRLRELTLAAPQVCFFNWLASGCRMRCLVCIYSLFGRWIFECPGMLLIS